MSVPGITLYLCISPEIEGYVRNPECRILNFRTWGYQCAPKMTRQFSNTTDLGKGHTTGRYTPRRSCVTSNSRVA